jgi:hypothetical protein
LCDKHGAQRHYHGPQIYTCIPVTIIEQIPPDTTFAPRHHAIIQQPLFRVADVLVSRITEKNGFEKVARWKIP